MNTSIFHDIWCAEQILHLVIYLERCNVLLFSFVCSLYDCIDLINVFV